jgi:hypothetical protein
MTSRPASPRGRLIARPYHSFPRSHATWRMKITGHDRWLKRPSATRQHRPASQSRICEVPGRSVLGNSRDTVLCGRLPECEHAQPPCRPAGITRRPNCTAQAAERARRRQPNPTNRRTASLLAERITKNVLARADRAGARRCSSCQPRPLLGLHHERRAGIPPERPLLTGQGIQFSLDPPQVASVGNRGRLDRRGRSAQRNSPLEWRSTSQSDVRVEPLRRYNV